MVKETGRNNDRQELRILIKNIYQAIPFKNKLFSFLKIFWKPNQSIYKHLHFKGIFDVRINQNRSFKINHYGYQVENELFWAGIYKGWEKESLKLWIQLCEKSDVILDIGANTGVYSLIAKTINPKAKVIAFEPVHRVFKKLEENILLNNYEITLIEKAVSNFDGSATIYDTDSEHTYSVTVNKNTSNALTPVHETKIETITLNSLVQNLNLAKIDLIKIDVETHEPEVLEGFNRYLSFYKPNLIIEILTDDIGRRVNKLVEGLGYLFFNINENGGIRRVQEITQSDYYNYLLCNKATAMQLGLLNEQ